MIRPLSQKTIDKIAAGEVVDRPLSVVKELIENSIDAGANAITVETKVGGTKLIRVSDNGSGIEKSDIKEAFLRHSTSKISDENDLMVLRSLGFRGEALSSISAVSKTELITKTNEEIMGTRYIIEGGKETLLEDVAAPCGSNFFIRDLFYNTPVRKKFLKSNNIENASIEETIIHLSLSRPDISFKYICDGKEKVFTSGSNNLKNTILEIFGLNTVNSIMDFEAVHKGFTVRGFIGRSVLSKGNRSSEYYFVNNRYVKSKTIENGIENGYRGYLMQRQFPFVVLDFSFPDGTLDVNVHPSKMEVRFNDPIYIEENLSKSILNRLKEQEDIEKIPLVEKNSESKNDTEIRYEPFESKSKSFAKKYEFRKAVDNDIENSFSNYDKNKENVAINKEQIVFSDKNEKNITKIEKEQNNSEESFKQETFDFISKEAKPNHRIIGQTLGTYWLIEYNNSLYIVDQHAAHEKVLFEKTMKKISSNSMSSQLLSPPIIISLSATEEEVLNRNIDSYSALGYVIEHFGGRDYKISGIPATLPDINPKELLLETLESGLNFNSTKIIERVASISCKAAVKGNSLMSVPEMEALLDELLLLDNSYHCPHGRPTMISFTRSELDKKFKRIL